MKTITQNFPKISNKTSIITLKPNKLPQITFKSENIKHKSCFATAAEAFRDAKVPVSKIRGKPPVNHSWAIEQDSIVNIRENSQNRLRAKQLAMKPYDPSQIQILEKRKSKREREIEELGEEITWREKVEMRDEVDVNKILERDQKQEKTEQILPSSMLYYEEVYKPNNVYNVKSLDENLNETNTSTSSNEPINNSFWMRNDQELDASKVNWVTGPNTENVPENEIPKDGVLRYYKGKPTQYKEPFLETPLKNMMGDFVFHDMEKLGLWKCDFENKTVDENFPGPGGKLDKKQQFDTEYNEEACRIQHSLNQVKDTMTLVEVIKETGVHRLDQHHCVSCLHKFSKFGELSFLMSGRNTSGDVKKSVNHQLNEILKKLEYFMNNNELTLKSISLVIWSLPKLEVVKIPRWVDKLLKITDEKISLFDTHQVCTISYALHKYVNFGEINQDGLQQLCENVVLELQKKANEIVSPKDMVYATSSFIKFKFKNEEFFSKIAVNAGKKDIQFEENQMISLMWSFASARFVDQELFALGRNEMERVGKFDKPHNIVMFVWALSVTHTADKEIFDLVWSKFEKLFHKMKTREACSVFWGFDNAGLVDEGRLSFFAENVDVSEMSGHDIATCLPA